MKLPITDLTKQSRLIKDSLLERIEKIIEEASFIQGEEVELFENKLKTFNDCNHAISCGNGTDALYISLLALDLNEDDFIICPSFSFVATAEVIPLVGAKPYFVDVDKENFNISSKNIKNAISELKSQGKNIRGIISVDLFGLPVDYEDISNIAKENNLFFISDGAQSFGSKFQDKPSLSIADISTTSFFPTKPLGCFGDGGAIFVQSDELSDKIRSICVHGKGKNKYDNIRFGVNSRLDTIQAAVLLEKMSLFEEELILRNEVARLYNNLISDKFVKPRFYKDKISAWAQYTLVTSEDLDRNMVMDVLKKEGISTGIYYPNPIHSQKAYENFPSDGCLNSKYLSSNVLSLPMNPYLTEEEIKTVTGVINSI